MHIRLVAAGVLMIVATTGTVGFMGVKTIQNFVKTRFEDRMQFLARYVSLNAELGILVDQKYMLNQLTENLLAEKDVIGVFVLNAENEVLASASKGTGEDREIIEAPVMQKNEQEGGLLFQWGEEAVQDEKEIGKVRIAYSTAEMKRLRDTLTNRFIVVSGILSMAGIFLFFFMSRTIVAQITRVVDAAKKVSQGDIKARPEPGNLPETRELTLAFNSMLDSIEWGNKALEEAYQEMIQQNTLAELGKFSMMVAHEFKNPLSIIKGSLNHLKKTHSSVLEENLMVQYMEEEIYQLNRLIEDFLLFSKPLKPVFRSTDLNETLSSRMERFLVHAETASIHIDAEIPKERCIANADRDLLIRVMDNLIKNALESSEKDSLIRVTAERNGGIWVMRVTDQGDGIPAENMEKIFEPFFTTRSKGSGLGLAFARQVIKAHNGTIHAENITSGGACFTVCLPVTDLTYPESGNSRRRDPVKELL